MRLTNFLRGASVPALFVATAVGLNAGVRLGDDTYLNLGVDANVIYSDNIYSSYSRTSDLYSSITPNVSLTHDSVNRFTANFWESFVNHLDHFELDSQYAAASLNYTFEPKALTGAAEGGEGQGSRLRMSIDAGFRQIAQNDNTYGGYDSLGNWVSEESLIRRDIYSIAANARYMISSKLNGSIGLDWNYDHFASMKNRYNDSQTFSVPLSLHYSLASYQLGLVGNYSHTDIEQNNIQKRTDSSPGNTTSYYAGLSFIGPVPFSTKLTLRTNIGYTLREFNDRWFTSSDPNDQDKKNGDYSYGTIGYNFALDWQVRQNLRLSLSSGRNFETGGRAQAITTTNVRLNIATVVKSIYYWSTYLEYRLQEFDYKGIADRRDNLYSMGTILSYSTYVPTLHSTVTTSIGYRFLADDSNRIRNFHSNIVSFTIGLRY
jgi:hypothetical protein